MSRFLILFLQIALIFLETFQSTTESETEENGLFCQELSSIYSRVQAFHICQKNGILVSVVNITNEATDADSLSLRGQRLLKIRKGAFKDITSVKTLYLDGGNYISSLTNESFRGLPNLENLYLGSNMMKLSGRLFTELIHLKILSLTANEIKSIPRDTFVGMPNLRLLDLSYNDLKTINEETFSSVTPELQQLLLVSNRISNIAPDAFAKLTGLQNLDLLYNHLANLSTHAFRGLRNLRTLVLKKNRLTEVSREHFRDLINLDILDLRDNRISTLEPGTFQDLSQLVVLQLNRNRLIHIASDTFRGLDRLRVLDLSRNVINMVDDDALDNPRALVCLIIKNNKLNKLNMSNYRSKQNVNLYP